MLSRSRFVFGISAALLSLAFVASAAAQRPNLGGQLQRQLMNSVGVGNMTPGSQLMYQSPYYGTGQPYYGAYQGQPGGYGLPGYQPQAGMMYNRRGFPYTGGGQYSYQQGGMIQNQPRYDRQLQPTSYTAPAAQRYQIPAPYSGTPAGYVINYGGRNYLSGSDGTMTLYNGPVAR